MNVPRFVSPTVKSQLLYARHIQFCSLCRHTHILCESVVVSYCRRGRDRLNIFSYLHLMAILLRMISICAANFVIHIATHFDANTPQVADRP